MSTTVERKPHKHAEFIKAWTDGAVIQTLSDDGKWLTFSSGEVPLWKESRDYRVKPEAIRYRVGLFRRSNGELYTWTADSDKEAEEYGRPLNFVWWLTDWIEVEV